MSAMIPLRRLLAEALLLAVCLSVVPSVRAQTAGAEADRILREASGHEGDPARLETALAQLDQLARQAAGESHVHYARGWVLARLNRLAEAQAAYREAIAVEPTLAEAHYNLAVVLAEMHATEDVIRESDEAFRLDPSNADAAYNSGQANYDLERYGVALARWRATQKLTPNDFQVARKVLQALNALGLWEEAALARDEAIRLWREKRDPAAAKLTAFCFDQLPLPNHRVFAYEVLAPTETGLVWYFTITDASQKVTLHQLQLLRTGGSRHVLQLRGGKTPPEPREFADRPAWRELKPLVREWAVQLTAAP